MHPSTFDTNYVKTSEDFFSYFKMSLSETLTSLVDQFDGLVLGVPIHYPYLFDPKGSKVIYYKLCFFKALDLKEVLPILIGALKPSIYEIVYRSQNTMLITRHNLNLNISFELFTSLKDVIRHEDWVHPYAYYLNGMVHYSPYTRLCLREDVIHRGILVYPSSEKLVHWISGKNLFIPSMSLEGPGCQFCPLSRLPPSFVTSKDHDDDWMICSEERDMLLKIAQGVKGAKLEYISYPKTWDQEVLILGVDQAHALGLKSAKLEDFKDIRSIMEEKAKTHYGMRNLVNAMLPLAFCEPVPHMKRLCQDCLSNFKPVWGWEYVELYKEELIKLYLVLSKHGMYWDLVLYTFGILTCLRRLVKTA